MASWIWVIIPIIAIVGAYIIDYQKNKLKWQAKNNQSEKELEEMRTMMHHLKKRIENLEVIVADSDVSLYSPNPAEMIEIDDYASLKQENQQTVANMAQNKNRLK
jgi:hypothetical protein